MLRPTVPGGWASPPHVQDAPPQEGHLHRGRAAGRLRAVAPCWRTRLWGTREWLEDKRAWQSVSCQREVRLGGRGVGAGPLDQEEQGRGGGLRALVLVPLALGFLRSTRVPGVLPLASWVITHRVTGPPLAPRMSLLGWTLPLLLGAPIVLGGGRPCERQSSPRQTPGS